MFKHHPNSNWFIKSTLLFCLSLVFVACASNVKKFEYAPTANATDEIRNLQSEMERTEGSSQMSVFAPKSYAKSVEHLDRAKSLNERGASSERVLSELGDARGFYSKAKEVSAISSKALSEVADARENAILAGAALHQRSDLSRADQKLRSVTEEFENRNPSISSNRKLALQREYLDIELGAIKSTRLGDVRATIDGARKMGASRYAPRSLENAESKLKNAALVIETDRHNDQLITAASDDAMKEAMKLVKIIEIARREGLTGKEDVALELYNKEQNIQALNQQKMTAEQQARALQSQNQQQQQALMNRQAQANSANQAQLSEAERKAAMATSALQGKQLLDKVYADAQKRFTPDEAEVFRQGDNLILRMKGVQFPSGRTELPSKSYSTLNKAKEVIKELNAEKVIIEGHTDATGKAATNKKLSQERAESVAKFIQDPEIKSEQIEARGFGPERPLTTNKTKAGRAQNRRVDIVIEPEAAETSIQ